ncbi:hypothetical protein SAMN05444166_4450 [Singulisphaera sp. GP187]|uniref:hypothetical protein n=1 Tax=Singulisphaera sp. GP187 TaxID=1882752 RepID=UPI00092BEA4A|nr:hypothetical protein [Singulisphaera sp. GP187]SIO40721.1 hypothetical protein SAMN05444166_4450 [Singulisphaera sp. GP187]
MFANRAKPKLRASSTLDRRRAGRIWPCLALPCCLGLWLGLSQATGAEVLPFQERFDGSGPGAGWETVIGSAGTIEVKEGWATFVAPAGGRSHIQRPAGADLISVSGKLARWASIYIVWDADNWCGVGKLSPTPFGRFYSIDVANGKGTEVDHRGVDFNTRHAMRIRLGSDHVAFQYELDGKWVDLRTIERPNGFSGAPTLVAAGKAYGVDDKPFATEGAHNTIGDEKQSGAIDEVGIEPTPTSEWKLTEAQLKAVRQPPDEPVNALLRQGKDDPTYEQIVGYYPPFRSPREIVGVAGHVQEIGVDWLGRLDTSPWTPPKAWFLVGDSAVEFGQLGVPFQRRLLHGYLPLVTLSRVIDGVEHELTVFGWSEGFRVDQDTFAYARMTARVVDKQARLPKRVTLAWGDGNKHRTMAMAERDGRAECFLKLKWPEPTSARAIEATEFAAKFQATATLWQQKLAPATRFDVPDRRVMEAYRAWIAYSMLNADTINGHLEPHDGAGFYDSMFGNSVTLQAIAMDQYGLHDYAAKILDMQCHFQQADGLYVQDCGLVDAGGFIAGLAKHYELTGDRDWLQRVAPNLVKQCDWILRERQAAPKDGLVRGLIKFRPYNDYQGKVYNYLGNAWCAQGMALAAAALKDLGAPEAGKLAAESELYRNDILDSMQAAAFSRDGLTLLPMEPDTHRLLKLSKYRGGDYWGLIASPLLGTDLLAPDDPRTAWIVDLIEQRGGLIAGVSEFQDGIDHAYTFGYLNHTLKRDEVRKTLLGFWSFMAFGMTRDTYSPVEVSMIKTGENHYTLPHLYSCTEQLRLLRNLLLREESSTKPEKNVLWLGQGIPRAWLEPGKHVAVTAAPTTYGDLSYRIDANADGTFRVHLDPPTRHAPAELKLRLRHPSGRPIASAKATPSTPLEICEETITLKDVKNPVDLLIQFREN